MTKKYRVARVTTTDNKEYIHDDVRIFIDGEYNDFDTLEDAERFLFHNMQICEEWTILTIYSFNSSKY